MLKVFAGDGPKTPRGSLKSLRTSPPVLTTVVVTFKFSSPSTSMLGVEVLTLKLGAAETATTQAARTAIGEENIMEVSRAVDDTILTKG